MVKKQKKFLAVLFICIIWGGVGAGKSYAEEIITFGPQETHIEGSIKYSVLGRYTAHFNNFKGRIILDEQSGRIQSVDLAIDVTSLQSNHPWYDKAARSRRLLYAARYPKIIFKSDQVVKDENGYKIKGVLVMHGIRRRMIFPFNVEMMRDRETGERLLDLKGVWNVNRKDFNIIWNKYLDHDGILVSDIFTVSWGIRVSIK